MKQLVFLLAIIFMCGQTVFAQTASSPFPIRVVIGDDEIAPTVPTLLTAVPIASSQIDLTWLASTDNFLLGGYVVWRDNVAIATTSQVSYSDTSLLASTTYTYAISAFDSSFNYSSTSNSLTVTTPVQPTQPDPEVSDESGASGSGNSAKVVVEDFSLLLRQTTADFNLETVFPARIEVRWGKSDAYELGYLVSNVYASEHSFVLSELEPGNDYEYEIIGYNQQGKMFLLRAGSFRTDNDLSAVSPANVYRFTAVADGRDVSLRWELPAGADVAQVRVVRSHLGFPTYPQEGVIVYQGLGNEFRDRAILDEYSPAYYTIFTYDKYGNVSSGAISVVYDLAQLADDSGQAQDPSLIGTPVIHDEATSSIDFSRLPPETTMPNLTDIMLVQGMQIFSLADKNIEMYAEQSFRIKIPAGLVSRHLKTIIVTVLDPKDNTKAYSYLLKLDKQKQKYEAVIQAGVVVGRTQIKVSIYDLESFVVASYQAPIKLIESRDIASSGVIFPDKLFTNPVWGWSLILLFIIFAMPHLARGSARRHPFRKI